MMYRIIVFFTSFVIAYGATNPSGCGKRPLVENDNRIVGGSIAVAGDYGWQVSITNNGRHFCGGVLIDNSWVLSAAHCFSASTIIANLNVVFGVHNRTFNEPWVVSRKVNKVISHASFNANQFTNDISLVKLASPIQYDDKYVIAACLPDGSEGMSETAPSVVTGWGASFLNGALLPVLYQSEFILKTNASCKTKYGNLFDATKQICAVEVGAAAGPCQGDSGGPLVTKIGNSWYNIGIVSWGYGCGDGGVYTRVSAYKPWIETNIQNNP